MGRGKIEIKKIENVNSRQVTFSKRRMGLFKKARELAILCDADVAVVIFSNTGKLFEFASSSMKRILSRYKKCLDTNKQAPVEESKPEIEIEQPDEKDVLKEEIEKLKLKQLRLLGKDFTGMGIQELQVLEQQLNDGLLCIKKRKENMMMQEIEQYKMQEQRSMLENETLRRQVEELRAFLPSTSSATPLCTKYHSTLQKSDTAVKEEGSRSPEIACHEELDDEDDSDTTLHLAPPNGICRKRKTPDGEIHSNVTHAQLRLN